jgi:hypothetical protein
MIVKEMIIYINSNMSDTKVTEQTEVVVQRQKPGRKPKVPLTAEQLVTKMRRNAKRTAELRKRDSQLRKMDKMYREFDVDIIQLYKERRSIPCLIPAFSEGPKDE